MARRSYRFVAFLFVALASPVWGESPQPSASTWHDINGQLLISGVFSGLNSDFTSVGIIQADNTKAAVQLDTLSLADSAFVWTNENKESEFRHTIRQWTSSNGKHRVEAKAIAIIWPTIRLARDDDKLATVALGDLSKEDRDYVARLQAAIKSAKEKAGVDSVFLFSDAQFSSVAAFNGRNTSNIGRRRQLESQATAVTRNIDPVEYAAGTVYVTNTGTKYHSAGCRHLSKSSIPIPLSEAARRYSPCGACSPPVIIATNDATQDSISAVSPRPNVSSPSATSRYGLSDRNPYNEEVTGHTATGIPVFTGPRGGRYHYSKSGKKVYERKQ